MKLTGSQVKNAKPADRDYKLADGEGLTLLVKRNGAKYWRLRYRYGGLEKMLSLGVYPDTTLSSARNKRKEARELIADGIDPSAERQAEKAAQADSFRVVAEQFMQEHVAKERAKQSTVDLMRRRLDLYLYPRIGKRPVSAITSQELLRALRRVEAKGTLETARRLRVYAGQVFRYAIAHGMAENDPSEALKGALTSKPPKHMAHLHTPKEIGGLMRAIWGDDGGHASTNAALKLSALTFARPGEIRRAEWSEFDFDAAEWRVPASKMKSGKPHIVPLSKQAVEVLKEIHQITGPTGYVFHSIRTKKRPMSENTVNVALRRLGYSGDQMTAHGFRGMASTSLHEQGFDHAVIERQLAHVDRNKVSAAYNHAQHLPARLELMQAWADYLDGLREGAKVANIGKAAS